MTENWVQPTQAPEKPQRNRLLYLASGVSLSFFSVVTGLFVYENCNNIWLMWLCVALLAPAVASLYTLVTKINRESSDVLRTSDRVYIEVHGLLAIGFAGALLFVGVAAKGGLIYNPIMAVLVILGMMTPLMICFLTTLTAIYRQIRFHRVKALFETFYPVMQRVGSWIKRMAIKATHAVREFLYQWLSGARFAHQPFTYQVFTRQRIYIGVLSTMFLFLFLYEFFGGSNTWVVFLLLGLPIFIVSSLWYLKRQNRENEDLLHLIEQIDAVSNGEFTTPHKTDEQSLLYPTSVKLSRIMDNFEHSVEEQITSERMKIALVTNVSHDLKTPLTSIISYIDLLKQEELSEEARDYVGILAQKSDRLRHIVADLFDLAKVTSGEAMIEHELLDMARLTIQTIVDMDDHIAQSGMVLRQTIQDPPVTIRGDGKKLYRVLQNVVDNALKYSLQGSRIYLDLFTTETDSVLTLKNTSESEMHFTAEEIMERFVRGDQARSTEGSGLGLSIAKSFTEACGGKFAVSVDGDQFKVTILFPLVTE